MKSVLVISAVALPVLILIPLLTLSASSFHLPRGPSNLIHKPKLFDFVYYQKLYNKVYANEAEFVRRSKLFYARAFKVFVVGVKYIHKLSTIYLKITHLSDRTEKERLELMSIDYREHPDEAAETHAVEAEDVDQELKEIVDHRRDNSTFALLAAELGPASKRKRRQVVDVEEDLSLEDLMDESKPGAVADREFVEPMSAQEADEIDRKAANEGHEYLSRLAVDESSTSEQQLERPTTDETRVFLDYRDTGCIGPIKNQGPCNSCYIFISIALYEYHHCIQRGHLIPFSEQLVLDCAPYEAGLNACEGGTEWAASEFLSFKGLEPEASYPYRAKNGTCQFDRDSPKAVASHKQVKQARGQWLVTKNQFNAETLQENLEKYGPLTVALSSHENFPEYGGGVDMLQSCSEAGHGMVIVGHGIENGHEYFLIKNSYGSDWGESGYYKLSKKFNHECIIRFGYIQVDFDQSVTTKANGH